MNSNWSYSPETVKLGCDLCDLDLWPWPFAWTLRWSLVITPENFMMIRWWEHSQKGVTDRRTDRRTENTICRAAWSQLKIEQKHRMTSCTWGRGWPTKSVIDHRTWSIIGHSTKHQNNIVLRLTLILLLHHVSTGLIAGIIKNLNSVQMSW